MASVILLENGTSRFVTEDGAGFIMEEYPLSWEAGRIFDIDFDDSPDADGALLTVTPSSVSSAYKATDVDGRQGKLFKNKINGHAAGYYGSDATSVKGASIPALPTGLTSFSVGLVANQDIGQEAVGTRIISADINWLITFTRNGLQFYTGSTIVGQNPSTITGGQPHIALAEISPTGAAFYVDGTLKGSVAGAFSIPAQVFLGYSVGGSGESAMAFIARVKAWNKVLSATERDAWFSDMKRIYGLVPTTVIPASDTTAPTVTITEPAAGATISGANNPFTATATDNVAVRGIKFFLNNVLIGAEDTTSPYSVNVDAATLAAGTHTLKAVAYDTAGNASLEATRSVTVAAAADTTAPTVGAMSAPTVVSSSRIDLSWTAGTDAVGVTGYEITYSLSSAFTSPVIITPGNVLAYSHTGLAAGTIYYYKLRAFDAAGNYSAFSNTVSATTTAASTAAIWEAGRIFDIDYDNSPSADFQRLTVTPSSVSSAYQATEVPGREANLYKNQINGHAVGHYANEGGINRGASIPALPTGLTSFSVGLIAHQNTGLEATATRIISADTDWYITFTRNGAQFFAGSTIAGENPSSITGGQFHIALAEISPTGAAFYVDGTLKGSKTGTFPIPAQVFLGWSTGGLGEPAMAAIARVKTWNKVLSATERAAWFADMKARYAIP